MICRLFPLALALSLVPVALWPLTLDFPGIPVLTHAETSKAGSVQVPVGPWKEGDMKSETAIGHVSLQAWKLENTGLTTLQILDPLRKQLKDAGFEILFECETLGCGGFDFRYGMTVIPEPDMHVDLGNFRFLSARRKVSGGPVDAEQGKETTEHVALLISRSPSTGFVQMIHVAPHADVAVKATGKPAAKSPLPVAGQPRLSQPEENIDLAARLESEGRVVLEDLSFETGSSALSNRRFESLEALAAYLKANPERRVVLVGHTDAEGTLPGNIALSRKRATAVVDRLVAEYGVRPGQISAAGMGYLAPRASNLTEEGRSMNRRVEAILTSTR